MSDPRQVAAEPIASALLAKGADPAALFPTLTSAQIARIASRSDTFCY